MEVLFLVGLEFLLVVWAVLWIWASWRQRLAKAELERYQRWSCPNCHQAFGSDAIILCTVADRNVKRRRDWSVRCVGIHCPHCQFLNSFDPSGKPEFGPGAFYDREQTRQQEDRWERIARDLACPVCGTLYDGWSGRVWGPHDAPLGFRSPVMRCVHCRTDAYAVEEAEGTRFVQVIPFSESSLTND